MAKVDRVGSSRVCPSRSGREHARLKCVRAGWRAGGLALVANSSAKVLCFVSNGPADSSPFALGLPVLPCGWF